METLATLKQFLVVLCLLPTDQSTSRWKKLAYMIITFVVVNTVVAATIASIVFVAKYMWTDFEASLHALLVIFGLSGETYMIVVSILVQHKIKYVLDNLAEIHNQNKSSETLQFEENAESNCTRIAKKGLKFVLIGYLVSTSMNSGVSLIHCYHKNGFFDVADVYHPFQYTLPWNRQNLTGYLFEILFALIYGVSFLSGNCALLLLFISFFLHQKEFKHRLAYSFQKLDNGDQKRNDIKLVRDNIILHRSVREWSDETSEIFRRYIMVLLINFTLYMACVAFQLDMQIHQLNFTILIILISAMVCVTNLFLYCFFGKLVTDNFKEMSDNMYEANWSVLPVEIQKHFVLMIGYAQKPFYYHGFGIAILQLETFTRMIRAVYTYYMLFKTFMVN